MPCQIQWRNSSKKCATQSHWLYRDSFFASQQRANLIGVAVALLIGSLTLTHKLTPLKLEAAVYTGFSNRPIENEILIGSLLGASYSFGIDRKSRIGIRAEAGLEWPFSFPNRVELHTTELELVRFGFIIFGAVQTRGWNVDSSAKKIRRTGLSSRDFSAGQFLWGTRDQKPSTRKLCPSLRH